MVCTVMFLNFVGHRTKFKFDKNHLGSNVLIDLYLHFSIYLAGLVGQNSCVIKCIASILPTENL